MASLLKVLRGSNGHEDAALAEMRLLAEQIAGDRAGIEMLITKARDAGNELRELAEPIRELSGRLAALERQMVEVDRRVPAVTAAQDQAVAFETTHQKIAARLESAAAQVARVESDIGDLGDLVETAAGLRRELGAFLETENPLRALAADADELRGKLGELAGGYGRLRERQDDAEQTCKQAAARLQSVEGAGQAAARTVDAYQRRVEELESRLAGLNQLAAGASDTTHQLLTLKALADQVTQKASALENQRGAVERLARDVSRLDDLVGRVDSAIREQEDHVVQLRALSREVDELRSLHESVTEHSREITARQREIGEQERLTHQRLGEMHEQLQRATERFDLEHRGLESVSHRIGDLRGAVRECEDRLKGLDGAQTKAGEIETRVETVWGRVGFLLADIAKLDEQTKTIRALRVETQRVRELAEDAAARSADVERGKSTVEAVAKDLAALGATHEKVREALDQMRLAEEDVALARAGQADTAAWLKAVQEPMATLQQRVERLDAVGPTLESVQKRVEWTAEAMEAATVHRGVLDEMHARLAELTALSAQLEDRTKTLRSRLDVAEGRFLLVTRQADDAERIASLVCEASRTAADVDGRVAELGRSLAAFEGRAGDLHAVADRAGHLGNELAQRQAALDRASEHLGRASALRQEAADAAQRLDDRTRDAEQTVAALDERTKCLDALAEKLEDRSGALNAIGKDVTQFEGHLERWDAARRELQASLEQAAARQATVEALNTNIREMFDLAERTASDLREAASLHRDILTWRPELDDLVARLCDADDARAALDLRRQELGEAERRLARADAVLIDIQSSLESLHNEKATLDVVIEKAGALAFQIQQGEALIDRLRKERDVTNTVRLALDDASARPIGAPSSASSAGAAGRPSSP